LYWRIGERHPAGRLARSPADFTAEIKGDGDVGARHMGKT
jgi:hypothetical protein